MKASLFGFPFKSIPTQDIPTQAGSFCISSTEATCQREPPICTPSSWIHRHGLLNTKDTFHKTVVPFCPWYVPADSVILLFFLETFRLLVQNAAMTRVPLCSRSAIYSWASSSGFIIIFWSFSFCFQHESMMYVCVLKLGSQYSAAEKCTLNLIHCDDVSCRSLPYRQP